MTTKRNENFQITIVLPDENGKIRMDTYHVTPMDDPKNPGRPLQYEIDAKFKEALYHIKSFVWHGDSFMGLRYLDGMSVYYAICNVAHAICEMHIDFPALVDPDNIHIQCRNELEKLLDWFHQIEHDFPKLHHDMKVMVEQGNFYHYEA